MKFMFLVFTGTSGESTSGEVYVPCIYSRTREEYIWWSLCTLYLLAYQGRVHLVEFMYLVFTRMLSRSYRRRLKSMLLYLCYVFRALINSLLCSFDGVQTCSTKYRFV